MAKKKARLGNNPLAWITDTTEAAGVPGKSETTGVKEVTGMTGDIEAAEIKAHGELNVDRKQRIEILNMVQQHRIDLEEGLELIRQVGKGQGESRDEAAEKSRLMYFRENWQEAGINPGEFTIPGTGVLLILDSGEEFFHALGERLGKERVILVKPGKGYQEINNNIYEINIREFEDYRRLVMNFQPGSLEPGHIIHWWSKEVFSPCREDIGRQLDQGIYSLFYLTRALLERNPVQNVHLLYIYSTLDKEPQPQYEAISGFIRSLRREAPGFHYKTLGLPAQKNKSFSGGAMRKGQSAGRKADKRITLCAKRHALYAPPLAAGGKILLSELNSIEEMDVSYRNGKRLLRRTEEFFPGKDTGIPLPIKDRGVYLITGGIGGLGSIFAQFLAKEYRARLVLTDLKKPDVGTRDRLNRLEGLGAEVLYIDADISREQDVEALLKRAKSRFKRIDGIIHTAGIIRDALLINKTREQVEAVLAPKLWGTVWLDKLTCGEALDFFVLFSAAAGVVGNAGQCDYAYANRFMDSFAHWRVHQQRPGKTLSINWPLWKQGGMKIDEETQRLMQRRYGMNSLETGTGLEVFKWGLRQPETRFMVLEAHPGKIESILGFKREHSRETQTPGPMDQLNFSSVGAGSQVKNPLAAAVDEAYFGRELRKDLVKEVSTVLKINKSDIDLETHLSEFGFDSISFTEYSHLLNDKYNLELMPSVFFEHPTLESFARYLLQEYGGKLHAHYREDPGCTGAVEGRGRDTSPAAPGPEAAAALDESHQQRPRFLSSSSLPGEPGPVPVPAVTMEPIAIIGMSGVMPQSGNLEEFWRHLEAGKDLVTEIPPDRWDWREWYGDPSKEPNKTKVKWGGFMKEVDRFDADFFGILPREAEMMDPQQRIFMETVWQTLEDAGYRASDLSGSKTGIFVGASARDYSDLLYAQGLGTHLLASTGGDHAVLANRISYTLNLKGPSEPVAAACSSSLVAIHRAVLSIYSQECDLAIAGGVNVILRPSWYIAFGTAGMLSGDGKCRTFDKGANGYVRGEGCGAVLLKPLNRARADGDHIYAVITATGVNHSGRAPSLTSPNPNAQAELIVNTWKKAGIHPDTVTYIETHGTGTSLGDPIEINGLKKAFARLYREWGKPASGIVPQAKCGLGTVKTNIGHLETAAGIAGVIKVLLALKHKKIPGNLHFQELNPYIQLEDTPFYIVDRTIPWQRQQDHDGQDIPRRAGISSFGYSGVNAHVVLEEWPGVSGSVGQWVSGSVQPQLILLSAKNKKQLKAYAEKTLSFLERTSDSLENIAYTLQVGRESMEERLALIVPGMRELQEKLTGFCQGQEDIEDLYTGSARESKLKLELLVEGNPGKEFVRGIVNNREYAKLAQLWVSGVGIDWRLLYTGQAMERISLPTYPFARDRYWSLETDEKSRALSGGKGKPSQMHILIDGEVEKDNGSGHKDPTAGTGVLQFKKRFSGREFFIEDHIHTLPAVVYLEMLRAAGDLAHRYSRVNRFWDVVWSSPLIVEGQPKEVTVELHQSKKSHGVEFQVISPGNGKNRQELQQILHCRGILGYASASRSKETEKNREQGCIDIDQLLKRCRGGKNKAVDFYQRLSNHGSHLGPRFKSIREFYYNEKEALSRVEISRELEKDFHEYVLHPALTDSAIQTTVALGYMTGFNSQWDYLPYVLGELEIVDTGSRVCYAYVRLVRDQEGAAPGNKRWNALLLDKDGNVLVKIKHLVLRPLQPIQSSGDADQTGTLTETLYYRPVWEISPPARPHHLEKKERGNLLILAPHRQLNDRWQEKYPGTVILVKPGKKYRHPEAPDDHGFYIYEINPGSGEDYDRLVESLGERDLLPRHVLHSWTLTGACPGEKVLETQLELGVYSVFYLSRSLLKVKAKLADRVSFVYFYPVHREILQYPGYAAAAAVSGFARSALLESGTLAYKTIGIDMPGLSSDNQFPDRLREVFLYEIQKQDHALIGNSMGNEDEILYKGNLRQVKRLAEVNREDQTLPSLLREKGVYVITGGLGGLGMMIARHLAGKYKAKLVLADCVEASRATEERIQELRSSAPGSEAIYIKADVSCRAGAAALIAGARSGFKTINGIIHAAGLIRDAFLINKTSEEINQVLAPKVYGTVYLDEAGKDEPLDFLLLFSSLTVILGSPGQCDYAYANSFLDHFARVREEKRAKGERSGRTLSINWPLWKQGGMKVDKRVEEHLTKLTGIIPLDTAVGLEAFEWGLAHDYYQLVVAAGNREIIEKNLFAAPRSHYPHHPRTLPNQREIEQDFQEKLLKMISGLLKIPGNRIVPDQKMSAYGFDSISFTELSQKINAEYDLGITPDIFFDHPTLSSVVSYLFPRHKERIIGSGPGEPVSEAFTSPAGESGWGKDVPLTGFWEWDKNERDDRFGEEANHQFPGLSRQYEPVAVIGMSGVMPQSENLEIFWQHLRDGKNLVTEIPRDRWDWREYYGDPDQDPGKTRIKWGGFMKDADKFDPLFFNISPREAELMDPQLRLILETVWQTIEDAGYKAADLAGTTIGVFIGVSTFDYQKLLGKSTDPAAGQFHFMIPNRVSFVFDWHGPSEAIDTACSSSLTAVHRAVEAIQTGTCTAAIVGGVNLLADPGLFVIQGNSGALSPQGKCYSFDKRANGYVRGEGAGCLLLRPLSRAEADGDHIYAIIRGTAVNHCGHTNSPTTPSPGAQADVIIEALTKAGVDPTTLGYIETHGTATILGDPIEINGLTKAFERLYKKWNKNWYKPPGPQPHCGLGTVKTNIGHLEAGAGIASMIKVLQAMKYKTLPPSIHFQELNPYIKLSGTPFYIVTETKPWEKPADEEGRPLSRRAGVSSFGVGGTNAHVVLEEYEPTGALETTSGPGKETPHLVVLSAKNEERLQAYAQKWADYLGPSHNSEDSPPRPGLPEIAYTLQTGREPMPQRLALLVRTHEELRNKLIDYCQAKQEKDNNENLYTGNAKEQPAAPLVEGEEGKAFIQSLIEKGKWVKIVRVWVTGVDIDWKLLYPGTPPRRVSLPTYPFAAKRCWPEKFPGQCRVSPPAHENEQNQKQARGPAKVNREIEIYNELDNFFYQPVWQPLPLSPPPPPPKENPGIKPGKQAAPENQVILIIYPPGLYAIEKQLARIHQGTRVIEIQLSSQTKQQSASHWQVKTRDPQALDQVIGQLQLHRLHIIYFLGGIEIAGNKSSEKLEELEENQHRGVLSLFRLLKALNHHELSRYPLQLKVVTNNVHQVLPGDRVNPYSASLIGLTRVTAAEYPNFTIACMDIDWEEAVGPDGENIPAAADILARDPGAREPGGIETAYRQGRRYKRTIKPLTLPAASQPIFKPGGVYLITGGAGRIGLEIAHHLASTLQAKVILVGRSQLNQRQQSKISRAEATGGKPVYMQADVANLKSMKQVVKKARALFGRINGVIHAAMVLENKSLGNMTEETFTRVITPKVRGSVVLHQVLQGEPLDFMFFFSSCQSLIAEGGMSNYVAGNAFKDAFAHYLDQVESYPVRVGNWGFWGILEEELIGIIRQNPGHGLLPFNPETGIEAVKRILGNHAVQVIPMKAREQMLKDIGIDTRSRLELYPAVIPGLLESVINRDKQPVLAPGKQQRLRQFHDELENFAQHLLLNAFQHMQVFLRADEYYDREALKQQLKIIPGYFRLYNVLLEILLRAGFLQHEGTGVRTTPQLENPHLPAKLKALSKEKEQLIAAYPEFKTSIHFLWICLEQYPEILKGIKPATDVMFPGSSMELIEGLYKGNIEADYYNQLVTWALVTYIKARLPLLRKEDKIKILEVGAGTGGTSAPVFEALRINGLGDHLCYLYTDISVTFTRFGKERYGAENPFAQFKILDVEKGAAQQGYKPGDFDVVIATNVLHATHNIHDTIVRVKTFLKTNGWLIINEGTSIRDFGHLIFGLLEGWWLYRDEENRMEGCPLLDTGLWERTLKEEGFPRVTLLGQPVVNGHQGNQHVIIAESNGLVSQPMETVPAAAAHAGPLTSKETHTVSPSPPTPAKAGNTNEYVKKQIIEVLVNVLQMEQKDVNTDAPYTDFGIDSILAIEIVNKINQHMGIHLRSTDLFNYSSINKLTHHIIKEYGNSMNEEPGGQDPGLYETKPTAVENPVSKDQPADQGIGANQPEKAGRQAGPGEFEGIDIAIIGISGRFPGARHVEELWQNLAAGKNSVQEITRWNPDTFYDPDPQAANKSYCKWGGFLSGIDEFDPLFFNISPKEAELMDPQQRLFLEQAWKALEDAGYSDRDLEEKKCGVFVGFNGSDYHKILEESGLFPDAYMMTGNYEALLSARISYFLNLRGPAITVNTACSASLVAVHLACESIRCRTSEIAIAGGVEILNSPKDFILMSKTEALTFNGQCRAFDKKADGIALGEGVGAVVLKRLDQAQEQGDHIYGVIIGSAMNQDGRSNGITAPSGPSQTALECEVYQKYHINPETIGYIETHGTGTRLGDPIEIDALTDAFRKFTHKKQFCPIGSLKTNIGHLAAAAGVSALIKVLLCIKHQQIPPSLHYEEPNPFIDFENSPFYVNTRLQNWSTANHTPRTAAINSFGFSGTNVHLVVKEIETPSPQCSPARPWYMIPISAKTPQALNQKLKDLAAWLENKIHQHPLKNISYTLLKGRSHFHLRCVLLVKNTISAGELAKKLLVIAEGKEINDYLHKINTPQEVRDKAKSQPALHQLGNEMVRQIQTLAPGSAENAYKEKLLALADLYTNGHDLEWEELYKGENCQRISMPTYPFARETYWVPKPNQQEESSEDNKLKEIMRKLEIGEITVTEANQWLEEKA